MPGKFAVTDRGTASYSIPIEVPPGRLGMQPALSLNYASTKNNGMLGMGWSLGGLSTITRCPTILDRPDPANQNFPRPLHYTADDRFCLDGRALMVVPGQVYGADGAEYRTEIDTFAKIVSHTADKLASPVSFEVSTKDGRVLTYGATPDSSVFVGFDASLKRIWALNHVVDRSGNSMTLTYQPHTIVGVQSVHENVPIQILGDTGELVPEQISYGANGSALSNSRFVHFSYEARPNPRSGFVAGIPAMSTQRLTSIDTFVGGAPIRTYAIAYKNGLSDGESVVSVKECGYDGANQKCLPATTFQYNTLQPQVALQSPVPGVGPDSYLPDPSTIALDADGDGRDDLLVPNVLGAAPLTWSLARPARNLITGALFTTTRPCLNVASVIDVDRDGKDDLISPCGLEQVNTFLNPQGFDVPSGTAFAYISTGNGFTPTSLGFAFKGELKLADVNGDGLRDIVVCQDVNGPDADGSDGCKPNSLSIKDILLNTGGMKFDDLGADVGQPTAALDPPPANGPVGPGLCRNLVALDVNGDGREELVQLRNPNGASTADTDGHHSCSRHDPVGVGLISVYDALAKTWTDFGQSTSNSPGLAPFFKFVDLNGDGLKDIAYSDGITVTVAINTGERLVSTPVPEEAFSSDDLFNSVVLDYDGDGQEDLVTNTAFLRLSLGVGSGLAIVERVAIANPVNDNTDIFGGGGRIVAVADVDGDGTPDLIPEDLTVPIALVGHSAQAGLLERIDDGNGKEINVSYDLGEVGETSNNVTYFVAGCQSDSGTTCVRRVAPLVSGHAESQRRLINVPGDHPFTLPIFNPGPSYSYRYNGARVGLRGRGWFGFQSRTVTLASLWKTELDYLNKDFFFAGRLSSSERAYLSSTPDNFFEHTANRSERASFTWVTEQGDHQPFPFLQIEQHEVLEGNSTLVLTSVQTTRTPDNFGNVTSQTVETPLSTIKTTRDVKNDPTNWLIGHTKTATTTAVRAGAAALQRSEGFTYKPETNLVETASRVTDDASALMTVTYGRDDFGNVASVCRADASDPMRCTKVSAFDEQAIFPVGILDGESLPSTVQYSAADGQLLWTQDANGITSEYQRDAFGRLKHAQTPTEDTIFNYFNVQLDTDFVLDAPHGASGGWSAFGVRQDSVGQGRSWQSFDAFGRVTVEGAPAFGGGDEVITERQYDALGRLITKTMPHQGSDSFQGTLQYEYDAFDRLSSEIYPDGTATSLFYPNRLDAVGSTSSLFSGGITDANVQATVVVKPKQNLTARVFDADGLIAKAVQSPGPAGSATEFSTDNAVTNYHHTGFGMLTEVDSLLNGSVTAKTVITPDAFGRTVALDDPSLGHQTNTYGFDEVVTHTDAKQATTRFSYDSDGRPLDVEVADSNGSQEVVAQWKYGSLDAPSGEIGRLIGAYREGTSGSAVGNWTRYNYVSGDNGPGRGLLQSVDYRVGGAPNQPDTGEAFNIGFDYQTQVPWRIDVVRYPNAGKSFDVQYGYDPSSGQVNSVRDALRPSVQPFWQLLETDQGFRPKHELFGNQVETVRDYYSLANGMQDCASVAGASCMPGRLRGIVTQPSAQSSLPLQDTSYRYDLNGNVSTVLTPGEDVDIRGYIYDGFDRLSIDQLGPGLGTLQYEYDLAGNILNRDDVGQYRYEKPTRPLQVTSVGADTTYGYDDNGNQTDRSGSGIKGGLQHLDYDRFDMPQRVTTGAGALAVSTDFQYDGEGARIIKRKRAGALADGEEQSCSSNPAACVAELTLDVGELYEQVSTFASGTCDAAAAPGACSASTRTHRYRVYAGGRQVAQVERIEQNGTTEDHAYFIHDDRLGTTSLLTNSTGDVAEKRQFSSFGEPKNVDFSSAGGTLSGFTGLEHDDDLGLVNMRGRLYDPHLARFISPDPFVTQPLNTQGLNRYSYVQNRPLNLTDPSGYDPGHGQDGGNGFSQGYPASASGDSYYPAATVSDNGDISVTYTGSPIQIASSGASYSPSLTDAPSASDIAAAGEEADAAAFANRISGPLPTMGPAPGGPGSSGGHGPETMSQGSNACFDPGASSVPAGSSGSASNGAGGGGGGGTSYHGGGYEGANSSGMTPSGYMSPGVVMMTMVPFMILGELAGVAEDTEMTVVPRITPGSLPAVEEESLLETLQHIDEGTTPSGSLAIKWGKPFKNWDGELPGARGESSPYLEYRVATPDSSGAGALRIVSNPDTREMYYTWTHYGDLGEPAFVQIR